ncbi:MAG TPA: O-antigen ligase family protein [Cyclobacteriaceae bacterium]
MQLTEGSGKPTMVEKVLISIFIITITAKIQINSIAIGLLAVWWLVAGRYKLSFAVLKNSRLFLTLLAYYLMHVVSLMYSSNLPYGLRTLETKSSLIALPILLCGIRWDIRLRNYTLKLYLVTVIVTTLISLVSTVIQYGFDMSDLSYFSWVLPMTIDLPANYYALFVVFALVILIFGTLKSIFHIKTPLVIAGVIYLLVFLALLSSRASFFAFFMILLIYSGRLIFSGKKEVRRAGIIATLITCVLAAVLVVSVPYLRDRVSQVVRGLDNDPRYPVFKSCVEVISTYPIFGVGIGDVQDVLKETYKKHNFQEALMNNYNPHNDLLQIQVTTGIVGTALFLFLIFLMLRFLWIERNIFMISFVVLYLSASVSESVLERNKGVVFFAFFLTVIFILKLMVPTNGTPMQHRQEL